MGALLVMALKLKSDVTQLLMWIGISFAITVVGRGSISWQGHLGGFVGGVVLAALLVYAPRDRRTAWQGAGFAAVALLVVLAVLARTAALTRRVLPSCGRSWGELHACDYPQLIPQLCKECCFITGP